MSYSFKQQREIVIGETDAIFDVQFHPLRKNILAACTVEGSALLVDTDSETRPVALTLKNHHKGSSIRKLRLHDHLLITAAKTIKIYDLNSAKIIRKIKNDCKIYSLLVVDNFLLCYGDDEGNFKVFDYRVDRGEHMSIKECDDYISDLDIDSNHRTVVASSGEGTLSAFNIRAKRLEPPQSELFDAGFQCVRFMETKDKVLTGAEDGAINIFNVNEWGNISDRFPIRGNTTRCKGECSVDCLEVFNEDIVLAGSSDGKLRAVSIFPNKIECEVSLKNSCIEALCVDKERNLTATADANSIFLHELLKTEESELSDKEKFFSDL